MLYCATGVCFIAHFVLSVPTVILFVLFFFVQICTSIHSSSFFVMAVIFPCHWHPRNNLFRMAHHMRNLCSSCCCYSCRFMPYLLRVLQKNSPPHLSHHISHYLFLLIIFCLEYYCYRHDSCWPVFTMY